MRNASEDTRGTSSSKKVRLSYRVSYDAEDLNRNERRQDRNNISPIPMMTLRRVCVEGGHSYGLTSYEVPGCQNASYDSKRRSDINIMT
jgi:hypothetical protein